MSNEIVRLGAVAPVRVVNTFIRRINRLDTALNAVVTETKELAA